MKVFARNGYLVIEGAGMVRLHTILAVSVNAHQPGVTIRHGGKGISNPHLSIDCESFAVARELFDFITIALIGERGKRN